MYARVNRGRTAVGGLVATIAMLFGFIPSAIAYDTGAKWPNRSVVFYTLDPTNDANLRVVGSRAAINSAAAKWTRVSWLTLLELTDFGNPVWDPTGNTISAADFAAQPNGVPCEAFDFQWAVVCLDANETTIFRTRMYFNTSNTYRWNTQGTMDGGAMPRQADVGVVALHEFGHFLRLMDTPQGHPEAVMWFDESAKSTLREDDMQGATQMYGPYTGLESDQPVGIVNTLSWMNSNVTGFFCNSSPPPELGPRLAEIGVPTRSGSSYEMMAGCALAPYSYAYFTWFSSDNDQPLPPPNVFVDTWLKITPGMKLTWWQYNYSQRTMSLDFRTLSADPNRRYLRNSGIVDQNGVSVHPAQRGVYPTGQWLYFEADLTPLAGETIHL